MTFSINLSTLDGTNGFILNGTDANDLFGRSVSNAGDINGDGFDDIIIGAPLANPNGNSGAGGSYVVFGKAGGFETEFDLTSLDGTNGFVINGATAHDGSGRSVSGAGDVNGDGFDDLMIGAPWAKDNGYGSYSAECYVVWGKATGFASSLELSTLGGTDGVSLECEPTYDGSSLAVSTAGDINGDGFADIIIGCSLLGSNNQGKTYVVFGGPQGFDADIDLSSLNGTDGFAIVGQFSDDYLGRSVSNAGDVNGDGFDDLIVGAPDILFPYYGLDYGHGQSYVIFGKASGFAANLDLASLSGSNGFRIKGLTFQYSSGISVSDAGDVNGDGFDDVIVGSSRHDFYDNGGDYRECAVVVFGKAAGFDAVLDPATLDGTNGFLIKSLSKYDRGGYSVSGAGDVNGDGFDDLIIGAFGADPSGRDAAGETYVVFGKASGFASSFDVADLDGSNGFVLNGIHSGDGSGYGVSTAGDVNNDGYDDLIIGAPGAGQSYILFGRADFSEESGQLIFGTDSDDSLTGGPGDDTIRGLDGNDTIFGLDGYDSLDGGNGNDSIMGNPGDDSIAGGAGDDTVRGMDGHDTVDGGPGNDWEYGGTGNDELYGRDGDDTIDGGDGNDFLNGGSGRDSLMGSVGIDHLFGGSENDTLDGGDGRDSLDGGDGNDWLAGGTGDDWLDGGEGTNTLSGGLGDDIYIVDNTSTLLIENADEGIDTVISSVSLILADHIENLTFDGSGAVTGTGNAKNNRLLAEYAYGNSALYGLGGDDFLKGGYFHDTLVGGDGKDSLQGGDGRDLLYGNDGDDSLDGGTSYDLWDFYTDTLAGGAGNDTYSIVAADGDVIIENPGEGTADIVFSAVSYTLPDNVEELTLTGTDNLSATGNELGNRLTGNEGNNAVSGLGGDDFLFGVGGDDTLDGGTGNDAVNGGDGNDLASGGNGDDTLRGGTGNDTLDGGAGNDSLEGNAGDDSANGRSGLDTLTGGAGNDSLVGGGGNDSVTGDTGNDTVSGGDGGDTVDGGAGDDSVLGGNGADQLFGGGGNDTLIGGLSADTLDGGAGDDTLFGNEGRDSLIGGAGNDTFRFNDLSDSPVSAFDVVAGFDGAGVTGGDVIVLGGIDANTILGGNQAFTFIGTAFFSSTAGELRVSNSGDSTLLRGDVDGDGVADLQILIQDGTTVDASTYTANDFVL